MNYSVIWESEGRAQGEEKENKGSKKWKESWK